MRIAPADCTSIRRAHGTKKFVCRQETDENAWCSLKVTCGGGASARAMRSSAGAASEAAAVARTARRPTAIGVPCRYGYARLAVPGAAPSVQPRRTLISIRRAAKSASDRWRMHGGRLSFGVALAKAPLIAAIGQISERQAHQVGERPDGQQHPRVGKQQCKAKDDEHNQRADQFGRHPRADAFA